MLRQRINASKYTSSGDIIAYQPTQIERLRSYVPICAINLLNAPAVGIHLIFVFAHRILLMLFEERPVPIRSLDGYLTSLYLCGIGFGSDRLLAGHLVGVNIATLHHADGVLR